MQDFDGTCPGHPLGATRAGDIDSGEIYSSIASHHDWFHHDGPGYRLAASAGGRRAVRPSRGGEARGAGSRGVRSIRPPLAARVRGPDRRVRRPLARKVRW